MGGRKSRASPKPYDISHTWVCCGVIGSDVSAFAERPKVWLDAQLASDQSDADLDTSDRCTRT